MLNIKRKRQKERKTKLNAHFCFKCQYGGGMQALQSSCSIKKIIKILISFQIANSCIIYVRAKFTIFKNCNLKCIIL